MNDDSIERIGNRGLTISHFLKVAAGNYAAFLDPVYDFAIPECFHPVGNDEKSPLLLQIANRLLLTRRHPPRQKPGRPAPEGLWQTTGSLPAALRRHHPTSEGRFRGAQPQQEDFSESDSE